jgi:hypothetical protein
MPTPLLDLVGLLRGDGVLTIEAAFDHATVDAAGRLLMPMLDLLALAQVDADADVLMLQHADGSRHALRIADVIDRGDVYLQLSTLELPGLAGPAWTAQVCTDDVAPSAPVRSIRAMSFASFVGLS